MAEEAERIASPAIPDRQKLQEALLFASAAALKCTRLGDAFATPQRLEVEELLRQGGTASPAQPSTRQACYRRFFYI